MIHSSALHLQAMVHLRRSGSNLRAGLEAAEQSIEIAESLGAAPALAKVLATHSQLRELASSAGLGRTEISSLRIPPIATPKGG